MALRALVVVLVVAVHSATGSRHIEGSAKLIAVDRRGSSDLRLASAHWRSNTSALSHQDAEATHIASATLVVALESEKKLKAARLTFWAFASGALLVLAGVLAKTVGPGQEERYLKKGVAELVGTFIFIFSIGCNVLEGDKTWGIVSIACTLMVLIYAFARASGAHFNPAVSVALGLAGKMHWGMVAVYVCLQLAAGILAGLAYAVLLGSTFKLGPASGFAWWQAGLAELLYTAILVFVILNVAASKKHAGNDQFYGLAIAFVVVAGGYGAGSISGGVLNPAVAAGVYATSEGLEWFIAYTVFELAGTGLAVFLFRLCRPGDFDGSPADQEVELDACLLSEFLGTYVLVLTVGLNVLADSKAAVFSIASSLTSMVFALGSVSGAHFNPAVTAAIFTTQRGQISPSKAGAYIGSQLAGGLLAAFTYEIMHKGETVPLKPSKDSSEVQAFFGEFVFTFLLCFVVLSVATVRSPLSQYFGLAIGSCVTAGGLALGKVSGGSLNPAVSAGLALSDALNSGPIWHLPGYVLAELLGGVAAAGVFRVTFAEECAETAEKAERAQDQQPQ